MARLFFILFAVGLPLCAPCPAVAQIESSPLGAPATEQSPLGRGSTASASIGSAIASLAAVIAVIVACFAGYRVIASRAGGLVGQVGAAGAPAGILDLLGRYPIGSGQTLLLLKVDRRVLLVAQSAPSRVGGTSSMSTLCEITDADAVSSIVSKSGTKEPSFSDVMTTTQGRGVSGSRTLPAHLASDGIEVVDVTKSGHPLSRLARLGRKRS
ncbi:MAG: flagellar biosynthetic protein FliO [Planctomycetota bacterium]